MLTGAKIQESTVPAKAIPTDAYPRESAMRLAIGPAMVERISIIFRKRNLSWAIATDEKTLSGNDKAALNAIIMTRIFIFAISIGFKPWSNMVLMFLDMMNPPANTNIARIQYSSRKNP